MSRGFRLPGMAPGQRPATWLIVTVAAVVVLIGAIIAIDATTHRPATEALKPAPAFTLQSLGNPDQHVSLAAYRGHPVILNFFASWCTPCQAELPMVAQVARQAQEAGRGVVFLGVDGNDNPASGLSFARKSGVAFVVGANADSGLAPKFTLFGYPGTVFIDASGTVVKTVHGPVSHATLETYLARLSST